MFFSKKSVFIAYNHIFSFVFSVFLYFLILILFFTINRSNKTKTALIRELFGIIYLSLLVAMTAVAIMIMIIVTVAMLAIAIMIVIIIVIKAAHIDLSHIHRAEGLRTL